MASCGMYDGAGHWMTEVGLPAKSGVSGGLMAVLPQQFGVASYAPPLNEHGNSTRGVAVCRALCRRYGLHLFEPRVGRLHTMRPDDDRSDETVARFRVHGDLDGVGTEALIWRLVRDSADRPTVVVDLSVADRITEHARRTLTELVGAFAEEGRRLDFVDPQGLLD